MEETNRVEERRDTEESRAVEEGLGSEERSDVDEKRVERCRELAVAARRWSKRGSIKKRGTAPKEIAHQRESGASTRGGANAR